ncbi:MAG: hypothetical protein WCF96_00240 [Eubacteriales bacterium]
MKIGLILENREYAIKIGEYLSNRNHDYDIYILNEINDNKDLEGDIKNLNLELVIIDSEENHLIINKINLSEKLKCIILVEEIEEKSELINENQVKLKKFQSMQNLNSEIKFLNSNSKGFINYKRGEQNDRLFSVTSGAGGVGKSVISVSIARDISKRFLKRVLYLNLETFQKYDSYFNDMKTSKRDMSDFLYYLFKTIENPISYKKIESYLYKDPFGVYTFYPSVGINQLLKLEIEELRVAIEYICKVGEFNYIIIDFSSEQTEVLNLMYKSSNCLLLVTENSIITKEKNVALLDSLELNRNLKDEDKTMMIYNNEEIGGGTHCDNLFVEYDPASINCLKDKVEISMYGNFYFGIQKISDYLIKNY